VIDFSTAKTILMNNLGKDDPATAIFVGQCLNQAQRAVARAHKWEELSSKEAFFNTAAEYHTGTVAVTLDSKTVTGTTTVFPTLVAEGRYRFALSTGAQFYGVASRGGDTSLTLAQPYVGATASGLSYSLYDVLYPLAADVGRVESMQLHDGTRVVEMFEMPSEGWATDFSFPAGPGVPNRYVMSGRSADDEPQVLLGPSAPDAVYRVRYTYKKRVKDGEFALSDPLVDLVIQLGQALSYRRDHYKRYVAEMQMFRTALMEEIARSGDSDGDFTIGTGRALGTTDYLTDLMNFGSVEDV
jgi:hypothetical protein